MARRRVGVVVVLEDGPAGEVQGLRRALGDRSIGRIDPHVTLVAPLNLREADLPEALAVLRRAAAASPPAIGLTLGPVTTFAPANPVLYLQVAGDLAALSELRQRVLDPLLQRPTQWPWVPHVTVADDAPHIAEAVLAMGAFSLDVVVDRLVLLELVDGKWGPLADVALGPPSRVGLGGVELHLTESRLIDPEAAAMLSLRPPPAPGPPAPPAGAGAPFSRFDASLPSLGGGQLASNPGALAGAAPAGLPPGAPPGVPPGALGSARPPIVVTARRDGAVCGVASAWVDDDGGHIGVFVEPGARGQGVGRHLIAATEAAARRAGWVSRVLHAEGPAGFFEAVSPWARVYSKATDA